MLALGTLPFLIFGLLLGETQPLSRLLVNKITGEKLSVVGVWTAVLSEKGTDFSPSESAHSRLLAESFAKELTLQAKASGISILDAAKMQPTFPPSSAVDPNHLTQEQIAGAKALGIQGIVFASLIDRRNEPDEDGFSGLTIVARLLNLASGKLEEVGRENVEMTLGDAAYMGESWELRRWSTNVLTNVGFESHLLATSPFGIGPSHEQMQYQAIRRGADHPAVDPSCPFKMRLIVLNKERELKSESGECYVPLDAGDVYQVDVHNQSPQDAYLLLYIDGVNVLGKNAEFPSEVPTHRHWFLKAGGRFRLDGWTTQIPDGTFKSQRFIITPASLSVASGKGTSNRVGTITALFFSAGLNGIPEVDIDRSILRRGSFATGAGQSRRLELELSKGKPAPALLLAAMTIEYLTTEQYQRIGRTSDN